MWHLLSSLLDINFDTLYRATATFSRGRRHRRKDDGSDGGGDEGTVATATAVAGTPSKNTRRRGTREGRNEVKRNPVSCAAAANEDGRDVLQQQRSDAIGGGGHGRCYHRSIEPTVVRPRHRRHLGRGYDRPVGGTEDTFTQDTFIRTTAAASVNAEEPAAAPCSRKRRHSPPPSLPLPRSGNGGRSSFTTGAFEESARRRRMMHNIDGSYGCPLKNVTNNDDSRRDGRSAKSSRRVLVPPPEQEQEPEPESSPSPSPSQQEMMGNSFTTVPNTDSSGDADSGSDIHDANEEGFVSSSSSSYDDVDLLLLGTNGNVLSSEHHNLLPSIPTKTRPRRIRRRRRKKRSKRHKTTCSTATVSTVLASLVSATILLLLIVLVLLVLTNQHIAIIHFLFGKPAVPAGGALGQYVDDEGSKYIRRWYERHHQGANGGGNSAAGALDLGGGEVGDRKRRRRKWGGGSDIIGGGGGGSPLHDLEVLSEAMSMKKASDAAMVGRNKGISLVKGVPPFLIRIYPDAWSAANLLDMSRRRQQYGTISGGEPLLYPISFHTGHDRDRQLLFQRVENEILLGSGGGGSKTVDVKPQRRRSLLEGWYQQSSSSQQRLTLWALCTLYLYGGIYVNEDAAELVQPLHSFVDVTRIVADEEREDRGGASAAAATGDEQAPATAAGAADRADDSAATTKPPSPPPTPMGYVILSESKGHVDTSFLATTPRHPHLREVLHSLLLMLDEEEEGGGDGGAAAESKGADLALFLERAMWHIIGQAMFGRPVNKHSSSTNGDDAASWVLLREECPYDDFDSENYHIGRRVCNVVMDHRTEPQFTMDHSRGREEGGGVDDDAVVMTLQGTATHNDDRKERSKVVERPPDGHQQAAEEEGPPSRLSSRSRPGGGSTGATMPRRPPPPILVREGAGTPPSPTNLMTKITLQERMIQQNCEPSWMCNRCLHYGYRGSLSSCSDWCNQCFEEVLCGRPDDPPRTDVTVEVWVNTTRLQEMTTESVASVVGRGDVADAAGGAELPPPSSSQSPPPPLLPPKLIPRVVHQTWFEELSEEAYPHMIRLQNSWRATGWEYRFYDDKSARQFIVEHYPQRFVDAFDALVPGAFKADFFRYLVLLVSGGVYADIDIALDTTIESLIHPNMAFFVPLDKPGDIRDENFCLWNGLMGSAPGHPFLVRAVERTVNLVLNRADMLDMENEICQMSGRDMETWKTRAEPGLLLSGPCGLGVAVNEALGNDPLARYDFGWMSDRDDDGRVGGLNPLIGDTLILQQHHVNLADNHPGTLQLLDTERNVVVAATELSFPHVEVVRKKGGVRGRRKEKAHYSSTNYHQWVFGSRLIYADKMVTNEHLKLVVRRAE